MSKKRKLLNLNGKCRICLVDHGCMSDLFDDALQTKLKDLSKCTSIDIKNEEDLPSIVCHVCLYKLDMWSEFKEQFIQSNEMLLSHLGASEISESEALQFKRKIVESHGSSEGSLSENDKKKIKSEVPPLIPLEFASVDCVADQNALKEMYISEDEPASSKEVSQKIANVAKMIDPKESNDVKERSAQIKPSLVPMKIRSLSGKRGRTIERRKASTKRWVARKKALLAATGENVSDTDSIASDDTQLSPVQKARAKTNADKEAERQKRLAKALKNLETNMSGKYGIKHDSDNIMIHDTDSDARRTRSQKILSSDIIQTDNDLLKHNNTQDGFKKTKSYFQNMMEKENSPALISENNIADDLIKESKSEATEEIVLPHSVKSELEIGDVTYIVTSTLILAQPQYLNKTHLNNLSKESKTLNVDENSRDKNTDIIDAVQLRRIHPITTDSNEKKSVERCLNIEIEGTELEALRQVQIELADFVEKEMKQRLVGNNSENAQYEESQTVYRSSYQALDQKLKSIVEKAIKKNFETSMAKVSLSVPSYQDNKKSRTVSQTFVKAALVSKKFQPKVILNYLDVTQESKYYKINNLNVLKQPKPTNKFVSSVNMLSHKRKRIPCRKYNDYNTSTMDSDSNISAEDIEPENLPLLNDLQVYGPASVKRLRMNSRKQSFESTKSIPESTIPLIKEQNRRTASLAVAKKSTAGAGRKNRVNIVDRESLNNGKHICGMCGQSFNSRGEVELHVKTHKIENSTLRHNKHKMMRCKRCHEIMEARFVKAHICRSSKQVHKCYVCNYVFRTEKLLARHLESHDHSEFSIESVAKTDSKKPQDSNVRGVAGASVVSLSGGGGEETKKVDSTLLHAKVENAQVAGNLTFQSGKVTDRTEVLPKGGKSSNAKVLEKPKETYTCFVCDKIFTDEEVLKDHLQKHCDDMSEDEQSAGRESYQCAICGESMESEDTLEAHVEKHLFDDEDDNPNLIAIGNENESREDSSYRCSQCTEIFNSEMLLEMHMQAHEEEAAIAEWEKQGMKTYEFQCTICDEPFETEEDLSEHLDVHNSNAHVCQLCEKPFSTLEDLQTHVATH